MIRIMWHIFHVSIHKVFSPRFYFGANRWSDFELSPVIDTHQKQAYDEPSPLFE